MKNFLSLLTLICLSCYACTTTVTKPPKENKQAKLTKKSYPNYDRDLERNFPSNTLEIKAYARGKKQAQADINTKTRNFSGFEQEWTTQGPGNLGARITRVAIDPNNEDIIFAGFAGGGLWRTKDGGQNWASIFDDVIFNSIGDIAIDPQDSQTIYVGTGDPNVPGKAFIGEGLFKSTDGGDTWLPSGLGEQKVISRVVIHPTDSNTLYVASMGLPYTRNDTRGLYKSTDAGASWEQIHYVSDITGFTDIIIHPENPDILISSTWDRLRNNQISIVEGEGSGIYRSTDGGESWSNATGIPDTILGKTGLAICANQPNNIYAITIDTTANLGGIYRSEDAGETFTELNTQDLKNNNAFYDFGWYFAKLSVAPDDPERIFVLSVDLYQTTDNGNLWELAAPFWWNYDVHADKHELDILANGNMYLTTDGGLYKNHLDSLINYLPWEASNWIDIENMATTQFYRVGYNPHQPELYYGGAQDNGTTAGNAEHINDWERTFGGDGFQSIFNPIDPAQFFVETQRGNIHMTLDGGFTFENITEGIGNKNWDMPYLMSPHDVKTLYTGSTQVHTCDNSYLPEWYAISEDLTVGGYETSIDPTISALDESSIQQGLLYAGTSNGLVHRRLGDQWTLISEDLPTRYITSVKASPTDAATVYVTLSGYKFNEFVPRVYKSTDYGDSWIPIVNGLPDLAVNDIYILPDQNDRLLFAATDGGVYASIDAGDNWERLGTNMPNVVNYDLEYNVAKNELIAATFGRSIMTYELSELQDLVATQAISKNSHLEFRIWPSLTSDLIHIATTEEHIGSVIEIISLNGEKMDQLEQGQLDTKVEVAHYPPGSYLVRMQTKDQLITRQFVKI